MRWLVSSDLAARAEATAEVLPSSATSGSAAGANGPPAPMLLVLVFVAALKIKANVNAVVHALLLRYEVVA